MLGRLWKAGKLVIIMQFSRLNDSQPERTSLENCSYDIVIARRSA